MAENAAREAYQVLLKQIITSARDVESPELLLDLAKAYALVTGKAVGWSALQ